MKVKMTAAALALVGLLVALPASAAAHDDVIKVRPGQSIQAAIDEASPGDTIKVKAGTFEENVVVNKNDLTIEGAGDDETRLKPAASAGPTCPTGQAFGAVPGICAEGVSDVHITDLSVDGFDGPGILLVGTSNVRVDDVEATDNAVYGIFALSSTDVRIQFNTTARNHEAGIYVGDSPNADAKVAFNTSYDNEGFGVFIRDASNGEVTHNWLFGNCTGLIFLNTGGGIGNWTAEDNRAVANNRACAGEGPGEPGLSGIGIAVAGAHDIDLIDNVALHNKPSGSTEVSGGIGVVSLPGATSANVRVKDNTAFGNGPVDLLWDGQGTGIEFEGNRCKTSDPDGLCVKGGRGDHGDDDDDDDRGDHKGDRGHRHHGDDHQRKHHKHKKHKHRKHDD